MNIKFEKKSFDFQLSTIIRTSKQNIQFKKGWIIKLRNDNNDIGFGEITPLLNKDLDKCRKEISQLPEKISEHNLKIIINSFHPCIQSGINSALAEMNGILKFLDKYNFDKIYQTAILVDSNSLIYQLNSLKSQSALKEKEITFKWKVALQDNQLEEKLLEIILEKLPSNVKLRIDANGAWDREIANRWVDILKGNTNLDWLEQPLAIDDIQGMNNILQKVPVALDESLMKYPYLIQSWTGWQIRRPSQESNPLKLYEELKNKKGFRSISSSFETGIGRRMLYHFSNLQLMGPTPKIPGLAMRAMPKSSLFLNSAEIIWRKL